MASARDRESYSPVDQLCLLTRTSVRAIQSKVITASWDGLIKLWVSPYPHAIMWPEISNLRTSLCTRTGLISLHGFALLRVLLDYVTSSSRARNSAVAFLNPRVGACCRSRRAAMQPSRKCTTRVFVMEEQTRPSDFCPRNVATGRRFFRASIPPTGRCARGAMCRQCDH